MLRSKRITVWIFRIRKDYMFCRVFCTVADVILCLFAVVRKGAVTLREPLSFLIEPDIDIEEYCLLR